MSLLAEALASLLLVVGAVFLFVGSFGLAKLPDLMRRLHGPTKATTLGIGAILVASILASAAAGRATLHELLVTLFLFLTAPVSAQMIAKAHILRSREARRSLPDPAPGDAWATLGPAGATADRGEKGDPGASGDAHA